MIQSPLPPVAFLEHFLTFLALAQGGWMLAAEEASTGVGGWIRSIGALRGNTVFLGFFLGIWMWDFVLYGSARIFGRRLLDRPWVSRRISRETLARSEAWFSRRGPIVLFASRWVPGTRVATYLTAGFLKMPLVYFVPVSAIAAASWTTAIFTVLQWIGSERMAMLRQVGAVLLGSLALGAIMVFLGVRWLSRRLKTKPGWILRHWEFWPTWVFHVPVALNYLWLSIRYRGLTVPTVANPGIYTGGFGVESKYEVLLKLAEAHPEFTAKAWLLEAGGIEERLGHFRNLVQSHGLDFPLILKPDIGQGGAGVRRIDSFAEAEKYLRNCSEVLVIQRFATGPYEAGVFYVRHPECDQGELFAITEKQFPRIRGDGKRTLGELIRGDTRAGFQADIYLRRFAQRLHHVPADGESIELVEAGTHAQGCAYADGGRWGSEALAKRMDAISKSLPGFYIGRFDIRFQSESEFMAGNAFQIVELNGASMGPTHVQDSHDSIWLTYRRVFRQWQKVFEIGAWNRKQGTVPCSVSAWVTDWKRTQARMSSFPTAD